MPYKLAEIAAKHNVHYLPIVSSARAFRALWKRSYSKVPDLMAAVVYEEITSVGFVHIKRPRSRYTKQMIRCN